MNERSETDGLQIARSAMTRRARDFSVLVGLTGAVLLILAITSSLGFLEALMGLLVIGSIAAAYYVGSAAMLRAPPAGPVPEKARIDTSTTTEILAALPLPAFEVDSSERIIAYNAPAASFLRLDGRPAPPRAGAVIRSPGLLAAIETCLAGRENGAATTEVELGPDEHWRAHIRPIRGGGNILILLEDLTPVMRAARARADFLANASHELRTPLTAISGFIETMRGPARDDKESWDRFLDIMAGESERMSRLIADLLSLSRIESAEHVLPTEQQDFAGIVMGAMDAMQAVARERGVALEYSQPEEPLPVTANHDELIQVVENLISNAIKYSGNGGRVTIRCGRAPDIFAGRANAVQVWEESERMTLLQTPARTVVSEPAVWLRVEDEGPGIEREHLPRLGERFYRADQSRGGKITGTGLGLAIVKHIMAHHRGGLAVETRLGQGTAFGVWLPLARKV